MNKLAPYKLTFKFRPGKENSRADALSRLRPVDGVKCKEDDRVGLAAIEVDTDDVGMRLFDAIDKDELSSRQREDPVLGVIIDRVKSGIGNKLGNVLIDGVLMEKKIPGIDGHRIMVPKSLVGTLMKGVHDKNGHQGVDRVIARINLKFNWPGKYRDVRSHIRSCEVCNMCKLGDGKV